MAEMNLVEKANKVMSFRKMIRAACQKLDMEYPSDEKISEYINQGLGMDVEAFMEAYTKKVGIFKDPFDDFKAEVDKYEFSNKPTEAEMRDYIRRNGYDVRGFLREQTIKSYSPLEKKTLTATLRLLTTRQLAKLWNLFIEESAIYGEDSYIYDMNDYKDKNDLYRSLCGKKGIDINAILNSTPFVQYFNLSDGSVHGRTDDDIIGTIIAYWSDIFEHIMLYPTAYDVIDVDKHKTFYFDDIFFDVIRKHLGYEVKDNKLIEKK